LFHLGAPSDGAPCPLGLAGTSDGPVHVQVLGHHSVGWSGRKSLNVQAWTEHPETELFLSHLADRCASCLNNVEKRITLSDSLCQINVVRLTLSEQRDTHFVRWSSYRTHRRLVTLDCCVATRLTSRCFRTVVTLLHDTQQARRCKPIAQPNLSNTLPFFGASLPLQQAAAQTPSCPAYATDCQSTPGYARSGRYASPSYGDACPLRPGQRPQGTSSICRPNALERSAYSSATSRCTPWVIRAA